MQFLLVLGLSYVYTNHDAWCSMHNTIFSHFLKQLQITILSAQKLHDDDKPTNF